MNSLQFIVPDWSAPSHVKALVSTRSGGDSKAPFASLNTGLHVNDDPQKVMANRQKIVHAAQLPAQPVWLNQTHSVDIVQLHSDTESVLDSYDGAVTRAKNVVCAIMTADCLPLFISNQAGDQVALLHVGWRGLADGIIENGIKQFAQATSELIAWAGPCIGVEHFEIGQEVRDQIGGVDQAYRASSNKGKCYADLYQLTGARLAELGVDNYSHSEHCTYRDEALFFSHRRDQGTGRMVSLLWIE